LPTTPGGLRLDKEIDMKLVKGSAALALAAALSLGTSVLSGCVYNDGAMENAGESIDEAVEETADEIDDQF